MIPGMRADSASAVIDKAWAKARTAAGLDDVRLHDLRHSFASVGAAGGLSLPIIGGLAGLQAHDDYGALRSSVGRSAPRRQQCGGREDCRRDEPQRRRGRRSEGVELACAERRGLGAWRLIKRPITGSTDEQRARVRDCLEKEGLSLPRDHFEQLISGVENRSIDCFRGAPVEGSFREAA